MFLLLLFIHMYTCMEGDTVVLYATRAWSSEPDTPYKALAPHSVKQHYIHRVNSRTTHM